MSKGQTWNVSFRNFVKYLEVSGQFKIGITNTFKAYISGSHKTYVDDFVPNDKEVVDSLKLLKQHCSKEEFVLYRLCVECGARFTEIKYLIEAFDKNTDGPGSWNFVLERLIIKDAALNLKWEDQFVLDLPKLNQVSQIRIFPDTKYYRVLTGDSPNSTLTIAEQSHTLSLSQIKNLHFK